MNVDGIYRDLLGWRWTSCFAVDALGEMWVENGEGTSGLRHVCCRGRCFVRVDLGKDLRGDACANTMQVQLFLEIGFGTVWGVSVTNVLDKRMCCSESDVPEKINQSTLCRVANCAVMILEICNHQGDKTLERQ
jgi:hypothetical protein